MERPNSRLPAKGRKVTWQEVDRMERETRDLSREQLRARRQRNWVRLLKYPRASHPRVIDQGMRARAERLITNMTGMTDVIFEDTPEETCAQTEPIEGPLPPHLRRSFPRVTRSRITINKNTLDKLEESCHPGGRQFGLAETSLHELAHAVHLALDGQRREECFYKNNFTSEAGYDFTSLIFGGIIKSSVTMLPACGQRSNSIMAGCVQRRQGIAFANLTLMFKWPSELMQKVYEEHGWGIGVRWCRSLETSVDLVRPVSMAHIQKLFTKAFWEEQSGKYSAATLSHRNAPFWFTGLERIGESLLITRVLSKDDPLIEKRCRDHIHTAVEWRPRQREREDPSDVLADAQKILYPEE